MHPKQCCEGQAKRTEQTIKWLIMKSKDLFNALLDYQDIIYHLHNIFSTTDFKSAPLLKSQGLDAK